MALTQTEPSAAPTSLATRSGQTRDQNIGLNISIRTGAGTGRTLLSAFDNALQGAGTADFNLVTLSSVIPTASRIRHVEGPLAGNHGDLLFCVRAEAFADRPGDQAWAGLGWVTDETGGGLFVEHHGHSEASVIEQIEQSLEDMNRTRGGGYGEVRMTLASAECVDQPVCALVLAAYRVSSWHDDTEPQSDVDPREDVLVAVPPAASPTPASGPGGTHSQVIDDWVSSNGTHPHTASDPEPAPSPVARVTLEKEVDYVTARRYYALYVETFGEMETQAVARQLLHEEEFLAEMLDPRVHKYVAWDEDDLAIGMTTLTSDLETVPWVSPQYFAHHYPDHYARGACYYIGFTLVHPDYRGGHLFHAMLSAMAQSVIDNRGVVGWDMCLANEDRGLGASAVRLLNSLGDVDIAPIDRQTYFAVAFNGPLETATKDV
jgi:pyruvoyl-dependent arginine decarboxylase